MSLRLNGRAIRAPSMTIERGRSGFPSRSPRRDNTPRVA
jgi:hypothetical protein